MKREGIAPTLLSALIVFILTWNAIGMSDWRDPTSATSLVASQLLANPDMEQAFVSYDFDFQGLGDERM